MGAAVAWFEVTSDDPDRTQKFYAELFGWTITPGPGAPGYGIVDTGAGEGAIGGGIGASAGPDDPTGVKIYLRVDDLQAYLAKAEQLGGKRVGEPMELPEGWGTVALLTDPDGNQVGLWK